MWTIEKTNNYHVIGFQETRFPLILKLLSICLQKSRKREKRTERHQKRGSQKWEEERVRETGRIRSSKYYNSERL
jgi:hypothetical protein